MSDCLTDEQLEDLASRRLSETEAHRLHEHVEHCPACRDLLAECSENQSFARSVKQVIGGTTRRSSIIQEYLDEPAAGHLSDTIPGYELLHELHRGTQGVVYQAVQSATHRQMAIKFLREGVHASRSTRKRFEREIELVASLQHPNIIRVSESGVSSTGHHYYVMDYVAGLPLHRYVVQHSLALEPTLALFVKVCDAVNFAHQHGVIHRDLKPSNVLVDSDGVPHVLDFGLAKPMMSSSKTWTSMTGEVVGTLPYMAPEQARGGHSQIDIRADVYSLGVMLYQVLTGQYPYPVVGPIAEVLNHITGTEPVAPRRRWSVDSGGISASQRAGKRPGLCPIDEEVETIILRALAKEPERRYPNVEMLKQDIIRYLEGQPIEARRDAGLHVLRKSLVRYKAAVAATAAGVVLTLTFSIALWNMYLTQLHERERADAERIRVIDIQGQLATALMQLGDRALDHGDAVDARTQYQAALMWNQHMAARLLDNLPSQSRLADNYMRLGDAALYLREYDQACDYYRRFNRIMIELSAAAPGHKGFQDHLAMSQERLGDVLVRMGSLDEAAQFAQQAIEIRKRLAEEPRADYSLLESYARLLLTCRIEDLRAPAEALAAAREAVVRSGEREPIALATLALAYLRNGDPVKARQTHQQALALVPAGEPGLRRRIESILGESQSAETRPAHEAAGDAETRGRIQ
ncbi:MAG: protein kinase [Planctomycetes bacterium]|nr:protein kinase [Planctomycetota bacterium]